MDVVRFPLLRVNNYLVVKPEIVGPNFKDLPTSTTRSSGLESTISEDDQNKIEEIGKRVRLKIVNL